MDLCKNALAHDCGFFADRRDEMRKMRDALKYVDREGEYNGILIDTGANRLSIMSLQQDRAYCREHGTPAQIIPEWRRISGLGSHYTIGVATIPIPFPQLSLVCDINFHILDENVKSLLSHRDLKLAGIDLSVQKDCILFMGKKQQLSVENDFLIYRWSPDSALFTYGELLKLHRSFGHPSVSALHNVLKRARPDEYSPEIQKAIEHLTERCRVCTELGTKPRRFKLSIGAEDSRFNSSIAADIMYLVQKPALLVVDEATHFCAATFLRNISSKEVWKALSRCWINAYIGPPDFLRLDQGSQFTSKEFNTAAVSAGIQIIQEPIENPSFMSHVERYHAPLRAAFEKLRMDLPGENNQDILQMAVHSVNNTVGPKGLCPNLCVFGAIPRPARNIPAPQQLAGAQAIDAAMDEVAREQMKRKLAFALKYCGPYGKERSDLDALAFGQPVRVYRQKSKRWEGPFKFISKEGDTVCVQFLLGRRIFRSHVVNPDK